MKTTHKILFGNANAMNQIEDCSIELMITSPPYPMIEMWDGIFSKQNPAIGTTLGNNDGNCAFELMNKELDKVWKEVYRVLKNGGFACINIGNATRKIGEEFKLYSNNSRILQYCLALGFSVLPEILWRKQTNAPNKFMGSGMLPAGAYVTLEHEHILILRKGNKREFKTKEDKLRRQKSAFFWEERNVWFSDIWEDLKGTKQNNIDKEIRERSGAYPLELAYRLINMFSLREDTVLDPFLGTGTTAMASMATARNSIGFEIDSNFRKHIFSRFGGIVEFSNKTIENRIANHLNFVRERTKAKGGLGYVSKVYGFPVMTSQETEIDQLIAGCSKRMATFLQMLKETGARCGEIWQLNWTDIDFESKVVNITPEKNSNPRVIHLSNKLLEMLGNLPKNYGTRVFSFPHMRVDNHAVTFQRQRKKVASKIKNPRILRIHFHTFRYWKGTMLYHQTKSEFFVMQQLGHKSITNTLLYVQLDHALFQGEVDYIAKVAKNEKEICGLIEAGFEYVTDFEGAKMFRKRKT